jgi:hypothetical protein
VRQYKLTEGRVACGMTASKIVFASNQKYPTAVASLHGLQNTRPQCLSQGRSPLHKRARRQRERSLRLLQAAKDLSLQRLTSCCTPSWAHRKGDFLAERGLCAIGTLSFQSSIRTSWRFRGDRNLEYRGERKLFCNRPATPRWQIEGRSDPTRPSNSSPPLRSRYTKRRHRFDAPLEESTCVSFCESA